MSCKLCNKFIKESFDENNENDCYRGFIYEEKYSDQIKNQYNVKEKAASCGYTSVHDGEVFEWNESDLLLNDGDCVCDDCIKRLNENMILIATGLPDFYYSEEEWERQQTINEAYEFYKYFIYDVSIHYDRKIIKTFERILPPQPTVEEILKTKEMVDLINSGKYIIKMWTE